MCNFCTYCLNRHYMINEWISVKEKLPEHPGWYKVKTETGEYVAPFCSTLSGAMVWVVPDESAITHWKFKD